MSEILDQTNTMPANVAGDELAAFAEAARENLSTGIGTLLTYKKGKFFHGGRDNKIELPLGTELVAIMGETRHGHVKWMNGQIVRAAVGRIVDRFKPDRDVLGDNDPSKWPYDVNGKRSSPWEKVVYIPMVTPDAKQVFTFSTQSYFGREAAYKLIEQYAATAQQHPGCYPLVELNTTTNPTKKYGDIASPSLTIVDWVDKPQLANVPLGIEVNEEKPDDSRSNDSWRSFAREDDDAIPF